MKLKHRDLFLSIRKRLLSTVPDRAERSRYMEGFFTQRHPPRRSQLNHTAFSPGTGAGGAGASVSGGTNVPPRIAALDHIAVASLPDPGDVALMRSPGRSSRANIGSGGDGGSEGGGRGGDGSSGRRRGGGASSSIRGGRGWGDVNDEVTYRGEMGDAPPPGVPATLARRQLDFDGSPTGYKASGALDRWWGPQRTGWQCTRLLPWTRCSKYAPHHHSWNTCHVCDATSSHSVLSCNPCYPKP